jgi:hypothetical protein
LRNLAFGRDEVRSMTLVPRTSIVIALALGLSTAAGARDLFILQAGSAADSGHDLEELVGDFILRQGAFGGLPFATTGTLDYMGMANAIRFSAVAPNAVAIQIPSIGFSRTFTGTSPEDVEHQIVDFFEDDGADALAKFYQKTTSKTSLALLDGNPRATTALFARGAFDRFGLGALRPHHAEHAGHFDVFADAGGGGIDADPFEDLWVADASLTIGGDFDPGPGLYLTGIGQYRSYDRADIYDAGVELAIPIRILRPGVAQPVRWMLTPLVQTGGAGSRETFSGGYMVGGGGVSSFGLNAGPFEFAVANSIFYYGGVDLGKIENIPFDTELDQWITRNGAKLAIYPLGEERLWLEAGTSLTNFLGTHAAVDWYASPFAAVGVKIVDLVRMRVGWESDFGEQGYAAHTGRVDFGFEF